MARARGTILILVFALSLSASGWPAAGAARPAPRSAPDSNNRTPKAGAPREPDIRRVETSEKVVALTLDDGPDPRYTPLVLELARRYRIPLTFFLTGEHVARYPELTRKILSDGHCIGNHTWSHPILVGRSEAEDVAEIMACGAEIEKVCGERPKLFRPPKGQVDENVMRAAASLRYEVVLWSVAVEHNDTRTAEAMARRVLDRVQPGSIILAHDGSPRGLIARDETVAAVALIIEGLQKKGYRFLTVPQLLARAKQKAHPLHKNKG